MYGTETLLFNSLFLDFSEARDDGVAVASYALCSRQITTPAPHHWSFYRLDALPDARPTVSKRWSHRDGEDNTVRENCSI